MTDLQIEGVLLAESANVETREIPFRAITFGEVGRTNLGRIVVDKGALTLPEDVENTMAVNRDHNFLNPIGRVLVAEESDTTIEGVLRIARGQDGDALLASYAAKDPDAPRSVSLEVRDIVIRAGRAIAGAITGLSIVPAGAFPSATLLAADAGEPEDDEDENPDVVISVNVTTPEAPATEETEPDEDPDEDKEDAVPEASASEVMLAGRTAAPKVEPLTRNGLFALVQKVGAGQGTQQDINIVKEAFYRESGLFALDDITYNAAGDIAPLLPKQWLGEVTDGTTYSQTFVPLFGSQNLTSLYMTGWKWNVKPFGGTWTGNKAEVPSNPASFTQVSDTATRWAGANDIAREHRDFGTPGFFEAYDREMRKSFAQWLDTLVATEALAAATDVEAANPSGVTIGAGWSALIDGALSIVQAGLTPTGAIISTSLARGMLIAPQSDVLGYLSGAINLEGGSIDGFQFRFSPLVTTDHILVVSRGAADVYTLPGSPVRAEALNIANGGVDVGYFGYGGFFINNAAGIVDVAPYTP